MTDKKTTTPKKVQSDATKPKKVADDSKKREVKKNFDSYALYISRVLRSVFPDIGITLPSVSVMDSFVRDVFERIAIDASALSRNSGKATVTQKEIETATKLILRGDLSKHALSEGNSAVLRAQGKAITTSASN
ncbi:histone H2B, putative [Entamoeba invadens IP1]|uniref:Histone H2B n=1 Tax=Entamoeba invadens IP1 TaxID=370355 RepID=A0A0A1TYN1_ENTIV|nr:histone H2B, putative [Entamoeba invadens IP1]ELP86594.1 histone H2B, putative [Entamoeba invadens IP1]|eukprot:XP_004185940.1 histone H2B, putative [Entamoeba invadens IP1]